jgi:hypothetical protein
MAEQEPLEIESLNPGELSPDDLENASGGVTCSTYVSCSGYSTGPEKTPAEIGPQAT